REDLFFRINGVRITLPPLRERREDIPLLIHYFMNQSADKYGKTIDGIEPEAQRLLMSSGWKGNVRQLRNVIENMVVLATGNQLKLEDLPADIRPKPSATTETGGLKNLVGISIT